MAELRAKYAEVRGHLEQNRVDDAHATIKEFFEARRRFYNERHDRLNSFISPLLRSFCLAWKESITKEEGKFDAQKVNFMNDFLEFCIASQKYDELEVVLQECRCPIKETRANSPDDIFRGFDPEETGAQGQLANVGAPETSAYWEDSRTYCRTWDAVTMKRVYPTDPMFSLPFAVTVHPDRIEFADVDQEQALSSTEFMVVLRRLHAANDWRILSAWGDQQYDLRAQAMARGSKTHRLWIFPDDIVDTKGEFVLSLAHSVSLPEDMYRFQNLRRSHSEWMVVRLPCRYLTKETADRPNEPHENAADGTTKYHCLSPYSVEYVGNERKVRKQAYTIRATGPHSIKMTVPFIPWDTFAASTAYQVGLTFRDYMAAIKDGLCGNYNYLDLRANLCRDEIHENPPDWKLPDSLANTKSRPGFVGSTPSGQSLVVQNDSFGGLNLVSSRWCDWKHFSSKPAASQLVLPSGTFPCLGSIRGTWAFEDAVDAQWQAEFFVVDTSFSGGSKQIFNFVLSDSALPMNQAKMCLLVTSHEMRLFSASVSPYLFRYIGDSIVMGSKWKRFDQIGPTATFDDETAQWQETNRRDNWDRSYERRLRLCRMQPENTVALDALQVEYEREHRSRQDWDSKHQRPPNSSSSSVPISSTNSPATPSPANASSVDGSVGTSTSAADKTSGLKREAFKKFLGKKG